MPKICCNYRLFIDSLDSIAWLDVMQVYGLLYNIKFLICPSIFRNQISYLEQEKLQQRQDIQQMRVDIEDLRRENHDISVENEKLKADYLRQQEV